MRRAHIFRIAAVLLGGIVVFAAALIALLHTPPARRVVRGQAIRLLEKQGIGFASSRLDFDLLTLQVELRDVTIQSSATPDLAPLLRADRLYVDLSLSKLIRGAYHVEDATVANPIVHIVIANDGRDNIPKSREAGHRRRSTT